MNMAQSVAEQAILRIENLKVAFQGGQGKLRAVDSVSLNLKRGKRTALLGESGCGKSVLALAVFGLLPHTASVSGQISGLGHEDLLTLCPERINDLRGRAMVLIPQNPHGSLNPVFKVSEQIAEAVCLVSHKRPANIKTTVLELLSKTGFDEPDKVANMYPHQLSGGMAQRVLLSIGLAGIPELVVADEPTKGLDDEAANRCLSLFTTCFKDAARLLITHDFKAAAFCDEAVIMYAGEIVEYGPADSVLAEPCHPYAIGLMSAQPENGLCPIPGAAPGLSGIPKGCRFYPRCSRANSYCDSNHPPLLSVGNRLVRCFYAGL